MMGGLREHTRMVLEICHTMPTLENVKHHQNLARLAFKYFIIT